MNSTIELIRIEDLRPYPNNSRIHTSSQIEHLRDSIKTFGIIKPILIDEENTILAGHGIFYAAKSENYKEVPCLRNSTLSEAQKKAYIIADNKLSDMSYFDMNIVMDELKTLDELDFDVFVTGFDYDELLSDDLSAIDSFFEEKTKVSKEKVDSKTIVCPACGEKIDI